MALAVAAARFPGPAAYAGGASLVDGEDGTGLRAPHLGGALLLVAAIAGLGLLSEG